MMEGQHLMSEAVRNAYGRGEEDEAMNPIVRCDPSGRPAGRIGPGHYVIFYDIRGEREIQLTRAFTDPRFDHFPTAPGPRPRFVTMIRYAPDLDARVAFPPVERIQNTLCETVSRAGLEQVKIVETEKAVHLGYFLNGKSEEPFPGEKRCFVPSLKVDDYARHPLMELEKVTRAVEEAVRDPGTPLVIANFANVDVIGHIEDRDAVIKAVEGVDTSAGRVVEAALKTGRDVVLTADHGTVESWYYPEGTVDTGHTSSPVPLVYIPAAPGAGGRTGGVGPGRPVAGALTDVAPTVLSLLDLEKPAEMTGRNLLPELGVAAEGRRPVLLLICDGWGYRPEKEGNLIAQARTPNMDRLLDRYPSLLLHASGEAVGMPAGTVGNSEAGHLHIGAGRRVYSDRLRIDRALKDGSFFRNEAFRWAMEGAKADGVPLHLLGIVSFYSSHGSLDHLLALLRMARDRAVPEVWIHALLGRRGERPEAGASYVRDVEEAAARLGTGTMATVMGRFWALDREHNWDRIEKTYRALVHGEGVRVR